jgi:molybdopterin/thiamine biosynthesis adenylyltransferase/rhodanese-related sulfurtransferase
MTNVYESWLAGLRETVEEVEPEEASRAAAAGRAILIDIREQDEIASGSPRGATRIARGFLEMKVPALAASLDLPIYVICAAGSRSLAATDSLQSMGYRNVRSVKGGYNAWMKQGLPVELPFMLSGEERIRYSRHLKIPEVGEAGQLKLSASKVLLVGAGGLGCPAAYYLAAAGVGTIGLIDDDVVDRSNLQRQILHTDARVGKKKVDSARETLLALNPGIKCLTFDMRLSVSNVEQIFEQFDIVLDGTDNFQARYLINDACVKLGIPNVHGAVFQFEGYATVFSPERHNGPCYRCIYPEAPPPELAPSCAEAGVLGVLPGVIGLLQAVEAIKLIIGLGKPLVGRMLSYDALNAEFSEYEAKRSHECPVCAISRESVQLQEVAPVCAL